jgi:hypothetical protein
LIDRLGWDYWRYRFAASFPDAGAWHSWEIPELFGTYPLANHAAYNDHTTDPTE